MKFDDRDLSEVAKVLRILNPSAAAYSEASLIDFMRFTAYRELSGECTYCGTLGFYLTSFRNPTGEMEIKATISAYTVRAWFKRMSEDTTP